MPSRTTLLVSVVAVVACAPGPVEHRLDGTNEEPPRWEEILEPAPRPELAAISGAAPVIEAQAQSSRPAEDLGSRVEVRALPVPDIRRGASATFQLDDGSQGWVAALPSRQVLVTPAYSDGRVYVGGGFSSTTMYALDAETGSLDWTMTAPDGGPSAAIVVDDKVIFNTESCTLFVVDAGTGRTRWSRWLGDPLMSQPAATEDVVFSGHLWTESETQYGFSAMSLSNGSLRWQRPIAHDVITAPALHDDSVYFSTMDGSVYRLRQRDGRTLWRRRLNATTAPWVDGERVLVARRVRPPEGARGAHEQQVVLDASTGEVVWEGEPTLARHLQGAGRARRILARQAGAWGNGGGAARSHLGLRNVAEGWAYQGPRPTVVDGRAYLVVGDRIECRRLEDGELLWSRRYAEDGGALSLNPPAVVGSQMVIATADGHVYGLDIDTGMAVWAYDVGQPIVYQPSVARGWVYVSTARGRVVGFPVADETLDGWHMWGGDASHRGLAVDVHAAAEPDPAFALADDAGGPGEPTGVSEGTLQVVHPEDHRVERLPLEHTSVEAEVSGFVASVTLRQVFGNPNAEPLEAAYHFPLPTGAAVDGMFLRSGETTLVGRIARKERARLVYRAARDEGLVAALLEQQRPNLFTQRVSNIPPGEQVSVEIHYVQLLPFDSGTYEFVFPMVAGARAGDPTAGSSDGVDQHAPGTRSADDVEVSLRIDAGVPIRDVTSPSHLIDVEQNTESRMRVTLAEERESPNRDFVVRYDVSSELPTSAVLSHEDDQWRILHTRGATSR